MNPGNPPPNFTGPVAPTANLNAPAAAPSTYNASMATPEYSSNYPSVIPVVPPPLPANAYGSTISPYPQISPYDYSYQNDTNVGGIWEHTERTRDRKYYFNADFLWMSTKPPQGIFGNPNAQTYVRRGAPTLSIRARRQAAAEAAEVVEAAPTSNAGSETTQLLAGPGIYHRHAGLLRVAGQLL